MNKYKIKKRIAVIDSPKDYIEKILHFVSDRYEFEWIDDQTADYVFHSVGGFEVLKYPGVRIFVTGENITPNFAISDYALSFEHLSFSDRHLWFPLIKLYDKSYKVLSKPRPLANDILKIKTDFCAYVMSNTKNSAPERTQIFDLLCHYKKVNSGGKWRNNIGGRIADKQAFQEKHKFVIAFENCSYPGYLTEKFADAAAANAIPVYWGDPKIGKLFNPKAFINCHDFDSLNDVIERVIEIDQNDDIYKQMLSEPWFINGEEPDDLKDEKIIQFLTNIFDQEQKQAFRRNLGRWGIKKEAQLYNMYFRPHIQMFFLLRNYWRKFYHSFIPSRKRF